MFLSCPIERKALVSHKSAHISRVACAKLDGVRPICQESLMRSRLELGASKPPESKKKEMPFLMLIPELPPLSLPLPCCASITLNSTFPSDNEHSSLPSPHHPPLVPTLTYLRQGIQFHTAGAGWQLILSFSFSFPLSFSLSSFSWTFSPLPRPLKPLHSSPIPCPTMNSRPLHFTQTDHTTLFYPPIPPRKSIPPPLCANIILYPTISDRPLYNATPAPHNPRIFSESPAQYTPITSSWLLSFLRIYLHRYSTSLHWLNSTTSLPL